MTRSLRRLIAALTAMLLPAMAQAEDAPSDAELKTYVQIAHGTPYVGERVDGLVRGRFELRIARDELVMPDLSDFNWMQLEHDRWLDGNGKERLYERHFVFFPLKSGALTLPPFIERLTVFDADSHRVIREVPSAPVTLHVAPAPGDGTDWLPADKVTLTEEWSADPSALTQGATVERVITLQVEGADPNRMPKMPEVRAPWLISFLAPEERSMQRLPQGPVVTMRWHWTLRPITGEVGTLPDIRIPWFDRAERQQRFAVLPARHIGYAGFTDNAQTEWVSGFPITPGLIADFVAGLALAFGTLAAGFRSRP